MVIQRSLKSLYDSQKNCCNNFNSKDNIHEPDSDQTNNMNQMVTTSKILFSHQVDKFVTTMEMAKDVLNELKKKYFENDTSFEIKTPTESDQNTLQALELLRMNIQSAFDKEIDGIVNKYLNMYFNPAFENVKHALNGSCGNVEILNIIKCSLIENCKYQYSTNTNQRHNMLLFTGNITSNQSRNQKQALGTAEISIPAPLKNNKLITAQKNTMLKRSLVVTTNDSILPTKRTVILQKNMTNLDNLTSRKVPTQRRQIYWHTANISTETYFVLDVRANQAFGFDADGRERLASKHPELIRYLPDGHDRDWLVQQKIIPNQNRSSRFLLLVYDEVIRLGSSDLYKNRDRLNLEVLYPFTVPHFTIQKMKTFFIDLNIKSRGLITNSFSSNIVNIRSIGERKEHTDTISLSTTNFKLGNNSQLRNALLQASQRAIAENSTLISSTGSEIKETTENHHIITQPKSPNILLSSVLKQKDKSVLSSSHATLTALLTSNYAKVKASNFNNYKINEKSQTK